MYKQQGCFPDNSQMARAWGTHTVSAHLQAGLEDAEEEGDDDTDLRPLMADKDDGISCELGIRYPMLQAILFGDKNRRTLQAGSI